MLDDHANRDAIFEKSVRLFIDELKLCKIGPGQKVAILTCGDGFKDRALAFQAAARELGAEGVLVALEADRPSQDLNEHLEELGKTPLRQHPTAMSDLKSADLVVDLMLMLGSPEQREIQAAGARVLLAVEPLEILERLKPTEDLRRRAEAARDRLKAAKELRFTNAAGTDVTYDLDNNWCSAIYGYTDTPGRWDHWPSGFVASVAKTGGVNGVVVLDRGDILYPLLKELNEPIRLTIRDGMITKFEGGKEADDLRDYFARYNDPGAYAVSHIGWGLNDRCIWSTKLPGIGMDGRAYYGNVLFSTGPDTQYGGTNATMCHLDIPMKNCTLALDGEVIVDSGKIIPESMKVEEANRNVRAHA